MGKPKCKCNNESNNENAVKIIWDRVADLNKRLEAVEQQANETYDDVTNLDKSTALLVSTMMDIINTRLEELENTCADEPIQISRELFDSSGSTGWHNVTDISPHHGWPVLLLGIETAYGKGNDLMAIHMGSKNATGWTDLDGVALMDFKPVRWSYPPILGNGYQYIWNT